jgi:deoxyadenosine/deoxycytidine kinase
VDIRKSGKNVIQDRTIYEDAHIFAPNLHTMNLMTTRDFENYQSLFELMSSFIQPPDLLIYLRADVPTLVRNIQKRGRDYEASIRLDYLKSLNERYENWINNYTEGKLLIFDVDNINFQENAEDLGKIIEGVQANLHGLF